MLYHLFRTKHTDFEMTQNAMETNRLFCVRKQVVKSFSKADSVVFYILQNVGSVVCDS